MFQRNQVKRSTQKRLTGEEGQHTCFILDEGWAECMWPVLIPVAIIISITSFPATCFLNHDSCPVVDLPQQKPGLDWFFWSLARLWGVSYSGSLGEGRMETLGYSGGVEGVLRIEEKGGERVLKVHQWYTWPGADLGLPKRALHWDEHLQSILVRFTWNNATSTAWNAEYWNAFPGGASGKEPACQCRRLKRCGFDPWVGKSPGRRAWQPTPVSLPGESRGQRSLAGYSPQGGRESDMTGVT